MPLTSDAERQCSNTSHDQPVPRDKKQQQDCQPPSQSSPHKSPLQDGSCGCGAQGVRNVCGRIVATLSSLHPFFPAVDILPDTCEPPRLKRSPAWAPLWSCGCYSNAHLCCENILSTNSQIGHGLTVRSPTHGLDASRTHV